MAQILPFKAPVYPLVKADPGTIIHGTLRPQDLLKAFADELARLASFNFTSPQFLAWCKACAEARALLMLPTGGELWHDEAHELIAELADHLDDFAPAGHSFGAHEGDGADFGFWQHEDMA